VPPKLPLPRLDLARGHAPPDREEAGSPNVLLRRGFTKATVKVGTPVVVDGYQSKDGSMRANGRDITLPDGKKLFLGSSGTGAPYDKK
jgi:hypothetical protein